MLENPATPFMEILFSHDKFLHVKILPRNPQPTPTPTRKSPLKTSVRFIITINISNGQIF